MEITKQQRICDQGIDRLTATQMIKKVTHLSWRKKLWLQTAVFWIQYISLKSVFVLTMLSSGIAAL